MSLLKAYPIAAGRPREIVTSLLWRICWSGDRRRSRLIAGSCRTRVRHRSGPCAHGIPCWMSNLGCCPSTDGMHVGTTHLARRMARHRVHIPAFASSSSDRYRELSYHAAETYPATFRTVSRVVPSLVSPGLPSGSQSLYSYCEAGFESSKLGDMMDLPPPPVTPTSGE